MRLFINTKEKLSPILRRLYFISTNYKEYEMVNGNNMAVVTDQSTLRPFLGSVLFRKLVHNFIYNNLKQLCKNDPIRPVTVL